MTTKAYAALLRGINVGGNKKLPSERTSGSASTSWCATTTT